MWLSGWLGGIKSSLPGQYSRAPLFPPSPGRIILLLRYLYFVIFRVLSVVTMCVKRGSPAQQRTPLWHVRHTRGRIGTTGIIVCQTNQQVSVSSVVFRAAGLVWHSVQVSTVIWHWCYWNINVHVCNLIVICSIFCVGVLFKQRIGKNHKESPCIMTFHYES